MDDKRLEAAIFGESGTIFEFDPKAGSVTQYGYVREPKYNSPWKNVNPLRDASSFLTELGVTIFFIRLLFLLFHFARLPRFLAELVTAIIVGASGMLDQDWFARFLLPPNQIQAVETLAAISLMYYMFLVGLEMNLTSLQTIEKKVIYNVAAGILCPIAAGFGLYSLILYFAEEGKKMDPRRPLGPLYIGVALSITSFPDLATILSDLKILHTNVGRMALSSALVNDLVTWTFLIVSMVYTNGQKGNISMIFSVIFLLLCWFVVRPILLWKIPNAKFIAANGSETLMYYIFFGVLVFGFIADACGTHSMVGGLAFGIVMPSGEFAHRVSDKLEKVVTGILLPYFFVTVGIRTNVTILPFGLSKLMAIITLACSIKILVAFIVSMFNGMSVREGLTLGALMNTKGISAIILLYIGLDAKVLHLQICVIMVLVYMAMTLIVKPIPYLIYSPKSHSKPYIERTIGSCTDCSEFRILLCVHGIHNIAGLTNLLEYSNSTKQKPIAVFAAHLVELVGRTTAMLVVHDRANGTNSGKENVDQVINALEEYKSKGQVESVRTWTLVSPYDTMHEDIYHLAEDNLTNLILVPFNRSSDLKGIAMQNNEASSIRKMSQNLLKRAPCTVGLFLDRGMGLLKTFYDQDKNQTQRQALNVGMCFCGGPDNREALAYSCRMAGCLDAILTVVRFIPGREAKDMIQNVSEFLDERTRDDQYMNEFKFRTMCDPSISLIEKTVNSGHEIVSEMSVIFNGLHLCIVGKGDKVIQPFTRDLTEWVEYEELGPLGDALSASSFADSTSILVVQKYKE
ncbi:hypothetical protein Tsubulata_935544 [Turnera subulata]|uniref:Cation/H+ exchanger domain-containing protein n=1 Tax=Turnera subulata TaxID=218843 RepID=A0A9Q0G7X3_9ROSI|nr:hypothetical protein Tsubulata_935544 [Turnera subulata]